MTQWAGRVINSNMTEHRTSALSNRAIGIVGAVLVLTFVVVTVVLLSLLGDDQPATRGRLEALKVAGTIAVAVAGLATLWLAARRQRATELELQRKYEADLETQKDAAERRTTELYTKAADQLGSDKAPVRLAGLYALERVGAGAEDQQPTIANVICAYLRMPYTPPSAPTSPPSVTGKPDTEQTEPRAQERQVRLTAQRILHRHLSMLPPFEQRQDVRWRGLRIDLTGAELDGIDLAKSDLTDADLSDANMPRAVLRSATLAKATARRTNLRDADLRDVSAPRAAMNSANLASANLSGTDLSGADLSGADLPGADLTSANLSGADLTQAVLSDTTMASVTTTATTRWPATTRTHPSSTTAASPSATTTWPT